MRLLVVVNKAQIYTVEHTLSLHDALPIFLKTELNLNNLEKLTTEDEIKMDDQDEHAIDQVRRW